LWLLVVFLEPDQGNNHDGQTAPEIQIAWLLVDTSNSGGYTDWSGVKLAEVVCLQGRLICSYELLNSP